MIDFNEQWERLEAFEEEGSIEDFLEWMDSDAGNDWLSPMYDNYLIRRDTARKVAFMVMRRAIK